MALKRLVVRAVAALSIALCAGPASAAGAPASMAAGTADAAVASEFSAQNRPRYRRARPQIDVRPGRLLYRRCVGWLAVEHRLSGTVIVPRERCWWVRG